MSSCDPTMMHHRGAACKSVMHSADSTLYAYLLEKPNDPALFISHLLHRQPRGLTLIERRPPSVIQVVHRQPLQNEPSSLCPSAGNLPSSRLSRRLAAGGAGRDRDNEAAFMHALMVEGSAFVRNAVGRHGYSRVCAPPRNPPRCRTTAHRSAAGAPAKMGRAAKIG